MSFISDKAAFVSFAALLCSRVLYHQRAIAFSSSVSPLPIIAFSFRVYPKTISVLDPSQPVSDIDLPVIPLKLSLSFFYII